MESHPSRVTILYKGSVTISIGYIKKRENGPNRAVVMVRSLTEGPGRIGGRGLHYRISPI